MSLLSDIRFFTKKYIKNQIIVVAIAYIIYSLIVRYTKPETKAESLKDITEKGTKALFYDDKLKKYILVDKSNGDVWSHSSKEPLLKLMEA
jgi:hypothetical protein